MINLSGKQTGTYRIIFFTCLYSLVLVSCGKSSHQSEKFNDESPIKLNFEFVENAKSIELDEKTALFNFHYSFSKTFDSLFIFNSISNELKKISLINKSQSSIAFEKQGPNSVNGMEHSYSGQFVSADSIFFFSTTANQFIIANNQGIVLNKTKFNNDSIGFLYKGYSHKPMIKFNGKFIINSSELMPDKMNHKRRFIHLYDPSVGEFEDILISFPQDIKGKAVAAHHFDYKYVLGDKNIVISMPTSDSLIIVQEDLSTIKVSANSDVVGTLKFSSRQRFSDHNKYYWSQGAYEEIFYDPFRKFYIRVARSSVSEEEFVAGGILKPERRLIFLDSQFRKIDEYPLPENHNTVYLHPSNEGIYMMNFQGFSNSSEDEIEFSLLRITEKE